MPPRRSRQPQAREPSSANISWLSDDLLAKCFAPLGQDDRLCRAALVCHRWHDITTQPDMLRTVVFCAKENPATTLTAARSLLRWLHRHAQHVRSLRVTLVELHDSVKATGWSDFTMGGWVATATSLEQLVIQGMQTLHTWATLTGMTSLQKLAVSADRWQLDTSVDLPASLTGLLIMRHSTERMPAQVAALTNLRCLYLRGVNYGAPSMASLTRLTSLQHALFLGSQYPDSLAQLTGLQMLQISYPDDYASNSLDSVLQQLTQLTGLWLEALPEGYIVPPSLAALSRLQWLYLTFWDMQHGGAAGAVMPLGPWQRSLRHLAIAVQLAQNSLPFLSGAEQLRRLSFLEPPAMQPGAEEKRQALWRWAEQHEPSKRIDFNEEERLNKELTEAMKQLQAQRPALHIDTRTTEDSLDKEMLAEYKHRMRPSYLP